MENLPPEKQGGVSMCTLLHTQLKKRNFLLKIHSIFPNTINFKVLGKTTDELPSLITFFSQNKNMQAFAIRFDNLDLPDFQSAEQITLTTDGFFRGSNFYRWQVLNFYQANQGGDLKNISPVTKLCLCKNLLPDLARIILIKGNSAGCLPLIIKELQSAISYKYPSDILSRNIAENYIQKYISDEWANFKKELFYDLEQSSDKQSYFANNKVENYHHYTARKNIFSKKYQKFIGYGSGQTPFMDDFLAGFILGDNFLQIDDNELENRSSNQIFWQNYIENNRQKTNQISLHLLHLSARGYLAENTQKFFLFIKSLANENLPNFIIDLERVCERVLEFGHSSGTDTLCGIFFRFYLYYGGFL